MTRRIVVFFAGVLGALTLATAALFVFAVWARFVVYPMLEWLRPQ